jgi:hypothetical protein
MRWARAAATRRLRVIGALVCAGCVISIGAADARGAVPYPGAPDPGGDETATVSIPPPAGRYFGFHEDSYGSPVHGWSAGDVAAVGHGAGANSQRINVDWATVEPRRDKWDPSAWARYASMYNALIARGMRPVITVGLTPKWARDPGAPRLCQSTDGCRYPPADDMLAQWAQFVAQVAQRFPQAAAIEIWNEPNLKGFWKPYPDPARYARLVSASYSAIKQVNPGMRVLAGALAPTQTEKRNLGGHIIQWPMRSFLAQAYAASPSIKDHLDGISFHMVYQSLDYGAGSLFAKAFDDVRLVSRQNGDQGIPLWITEDALTTSGPNAYNQAQQAAGLLRQYRRTMTMPDVQGFIIHTLMDQYLWKPSDPNFGMGVISSWSTFVPKQAYCAFAGRVATTAPYGGCPKIPSGQ